MMALRFMKYLSFKQYWQVYIQFEPKIFDPNATFQSQQPIFLLIFDGEFSLFENKQPVIITFDTTAHRDQRRELRRHAGHPRSELFAGWFLAGFRRTLRKP
jgi:hypothetical protein